MARDSGVRASVHAVAHNRKLLRLESSFACFSVYEQACWVAVLFWAFATGGPPLAGFAAVAQLIPAAVLAPIGGFISDRIPRDHALGLIYGLQALSMGALAVTLVGGQRALVIPAAIAATTLIGWSRPAHYAAAAELSDSPEEAAASNSLSGALEGIGYFVGPALAGFGATLGGTAVVVGLCALLAFVGAVLVVELGLSSTYQAEQDPGNGAADETEQDSDGQSGRTTAAGLRQLMAHPAALAVLLLVGVEFVVEGSLELLSVSYAHTHLGLGSSAAGLMIGSIGVGATVGAALTIVLTQWRRLSPAVTGGLLVAGCPLVAMPFLHVLPAALLVGFVVGAGQSFFAVAGITLLQRSIDDEVMARILSLRESALLAGLAVGAAIAPVLIRVFGSGGAYAALGAGIAVLAVLGLPVLARLDSRAVYRPGVVALLRGISFLAVLDVRALERLAQGATEVTAAAGEVVIRAGDPGDRFYIIATGRFAATVPGQEVPRILGPGAGFGEIALIRRIPRTASVTALEPGTLWAIERRAFLRTLAGSAGESLADRHVTQLLAPPDAGDSRRAEEF
jgi:predicted MFS family arabinose efflux permease